MNSKSYNTIFCCSLEHPLLPVLVTGRLNNSLKWKRGGEGEFQPQTPFLLRQTQRGVFNFASNWIYELQKYVNLLRKLLLLENWKAICPSNFTFYLIYGTRFHSDKKKKRTKELSRRCWLKLPCCARRRVAILIR